MLRMPLITGALSVSFFAVAAASSGESLTGTCATPEPLHRAAVAAPFLTPNLFGGSAADCGFATSNPSAIYDPNSLLTIPVVVHVIMDSTCTDGALSEALVESQIEILNEDFLALAGSPGAPGVDGQIRFELATVDPDGQATTGITESCNTTWYNDGGDYFETLAWDPARYLNLYTNTANGARGYVPFLPAQGNAMIGSNEDRVVVNWLAFGRDGAFPPHDQGRTATHEVGHYLGLFHTYFAGCGDPSEPGCYSTGDLLCDTPPNAESHDLCPVGITSCGGVPVPIENYMELTDDLCMTGFTLEQARRMRCTLAHYRTDLAQSGSGIFADGFESGDVSAWTVSVP